MAGNGERYDERPGVDLAYNLMQSSYDSIMSRLNAVESRIQAVMVFSASFLFTAPVLVATSGDENHLEFDRLLLGGASSRIEIWSLAL